MQVSPHVHALKVPFQVKPAPGVVLDRFVYVYLICGQKVHLVDSGVAGCEKMIFDYLGSIGRQASEIATLVLTHSHPDHIGAACTIKQATGCRVLAHGAERDWIEDVEVQVRQRPVPGFSTLVAGSVKLDGVMQNGDCVVLEDGLALDVLHTPGHSRGSVSLRLRRDGVLFCGDAVPLAGDIPIYEDVAAAVRSIALLRGQAGVEVLLSSWDAPQRGDAARGRMGDALAWLERIHGAVLHVAKAGGEGDPMALCRQVLTVLGVPAGAANPLVARSFAAHLETADGFNFADNTLSR